MNDTTRFPHKHETWEDFLADTDSIQQEEKDRERDEAVAELRRIDNDELNSLVGRARSAGYDICRLQEWPYGGNNLVMVREVRPEHGSPRHDALHIFFDADGNVDDWVRRDIDDTLRGTETM